MPPILAVAKDELISYVRNRRQRSPVEAFEAAVSEWSRVNDAIESQLGVFDGRKGFAIVGRDPAS